LNEYILDKPTPYYVIDERLVAENLNILRSVKERTGCRILLAQKAFSCFHLYPMIAEHLDGVTASGLFEARLGHEKFGKENHVFSAAYRDEDMDEIDDICDYVVFNSFGQLRKFAPKMTKKLGLRINPQVSTQKKDIYDPCAPFSRLGARISEFEKNEDLLENISGLHFHTLCGQNADALEATLLGVEKNFSKYFDKIEWINFGGGHHITRADYDTELLVSLINEFRDKYNVQIYLEPGEAVVLNAGFLVSSVLDIVENIKRIAIMDTSAACHMPDVIEGPYKPRVIGEGGTHKYRLTGCTCLAGDIIGDYSFQNELNIGDKVVIEDMALYTMVKNNTFNGIGLPSIQKINSDGTTSEIKSFGYEDFVGRLG